MPVAAVIFARQADRQLRIGDHDAGHHLRMEDDLFLVRRLVDDDARAADLRAGAGRGRHRDHRRDARRIGARPPVADVLEVPQRSRLPGHERDDLAGIECRAAAEGDDAVVRRPRRYAARPASMLAATGLPRTSANSAGAGHQRLRAQHHRRGAQALVGHQQRPPDAEPLARGRQLRDAPGPGPHAWSDSSSWPSAVRSRRHPQMK